MPQDEPNYGQNTQGQQNVLQCGGCCHCHCPCHFQAPYWYYWQPYWYPPYYPTAGPPVYTYTITYPNAGGLTGSGSLGGGLTNPNEYSGLSGCSGLTSATTTNSEIDANAVSR